MIDFSSVSVDFMYLLNIILNFLWTHDVILVFIPFFLMMLFILIFILGISSNSGKKIDYSYDENLNMGNIDIPYEILKKSYLKRDIPIPGGENYKSIKVKIERVREKFHIEIENNKFFLFRARNIDALTEFLIRKTCKSGDEISLIYNLENPSEFYLK